MIALILAGNTRISGLMDSALESIGYRCMRFRDPIRAVDTFLAIDPDLALIDADVWGDYSAVIAGIAAALPGSRPCRIIAIASRSTDPVSQPDAPIAGAERDWPDSVIRLSLDPDDPQAHTHLVLSLLEIPGLPDLPQPLTHRYTDPGNRPCFMLLEPAKLRPRSFSILALRFGSILAQPDNPRQIRSLSAGTHIPDCAMLLDGCRMDFSATVASDGPPLWFDIESITDADRSRLRDYVISRSLARNPG